MAKKVFTIDSIWGGITPSQYFSRPGNYLAGIGIDPDLPISDAVGDRQTSGVLRPSGYATISSTALNDPAALSSPFWILTSPKTPLVYVYLRNGELWSYSASFGSETLIGTVTTSKANGAAYYNNYLYLIGQTDMARYGPLDGSPALSQGVWTSSTLGTQTPLGDADYPQTRLVPFPNHAAHVHTDDKMYFCDYDASTSTATTRGRGLIHYVKTTFSSTEGTGNSGSTYNALDLPLGYMPTDIESYGNDIIIAATPQGNQATLTRGKAALFIWDTSASSFHTMIALQDPIVSALLNVNGVVYIWSGPASEGTDVSNGYRVSVYTGGRTVTQVYYSESGTLPQAGAVDSIGDRVAWGTFEQLPTTTAASPEYYGIVMALGSKRHDVPKGAHGIVNSKVSATSSKGMIYSLKNVQQSSFSYPKFVVGWSKDTNDMGIDTQSTTYGTSIWRSQMFQIGKKFVIKRIRIPLGAAVAANMTITPKVFLDDYSSSSTTGLMVINNTNYANSERVIVYTPDISGTNNFCLELRWSGTALLPVLLPIDIEVEIIGD